MSANPIGIPPKLAQQLSWVWKFPNEGRPKSRASGFAKRAMDLLVIAALLPVWLPVLGICCLLVKIESPGDSVIFTQQRTGRNGRRFPMYKIRTMGRDAEILLPDLAHLNQRKWPEIMIPNDPRVTRVGRILRRTHLDELPQLFNVLRGDMSLVGPRPTSAPIEVYKPWHFERLRVQPGITGLWQVVQDNVNDFDVHVRLDIIYVERWCWLLDLAILRRTIGRVLGAWRSVLW